MLFISSLITPSIDTEGVLGIGAATDQMHGPFDPPCSMVRLRVSDTGRLHIDADSPAVCSPELTTDVVPENDSFTSHQIYATITHSNPATTAS